MELEKLVRLKINNMDRKLGKNIRFYYISLFKYTHYELITLVQLKVKKTNY